MPTNFSEPIILDIGKDPDEIKAGMLTLKKYAKGPTIINIVGSGTRQKIHGPAIGLKIRTQSGLIIRNPVSSDIEDQPGENALQGAYNRAVKSYLELEGLIRDIAKQIEYDMVHTDLFGVGEENGMKLRGYTLFGIGAQNGHENDVRPIFGYDGTIFTVNMLLDTLYMCLIERKENGELKPLFSQGMGIDLPPWALVWLRQGIEAGWIAELVDPLAGHNSSRLVARTEVELQNLAREFIISQVYLKLLGMRSLGGFYQQPTPEQVEQLKTWVRERLKKAA